MGYFLGVGKFRIIISRFSEIAPGCESRSLFAQACRFITVCENTRSPPAEIVCAVELEILIFVSILRLTGGMKQIF
jgi:hypothetical protein